MAIRAQLVVELDEALHRLGRFETLLDQSVGLTESHRSELKRGVVPLIEGAQALFDMLVDQQRSN